MIFKKLNFIVNLNNQLMFLLYSANLWFKNTK